MSVLQKTKKYWLQQPVTAISNRTIAKKQNWVEIYTSSEMTWTWNDLDIAKRKETKSISIAARTNAVRTNDATGKIENTQKNNKCIEYCDRGETVNHIINECSKIVQKEYKTWYDWVGKVIH